MDPDFHPSLVSHQPNPAQKPLSEFFLQLGPERYLLLQLNNGQIVTLRDFKPVCNCFFIFHFLKDLSQINLAQLQPKATLGREPN